MAKNILFLLGSHKEDGSVIDSRTKDLCDFLDLGAVTDEQGVALTSDAFDFAYVTTENCYTASGVISPTKWKRSLLNNDKLGELIAPYKAIITLDAAATTVFTRDRFNIAVKNKYSFKGIAVFPAQIVNSDDGRFIELLNRIVNAYTYTEAGAIPQPALTKCILVESPEGVLEMLNRCLETGLCVVDVETNEIDKGKDNRVRYYQEGFKVTTLSVSPCAGVSYVMSVEYKDKSSEAYIETLLAALKTLFLHKDVIKVAHNLKYDLNALSIYGITEYDGRFADTMLMAHLVNELESVSLERLTEMYLPTFHGYKIKNFNIPFNELAVYNAQDTDNTCRLFNFLEIKLREDMRKYKLYRSVIMPTFWELYYAERHGALIDTDYINQSIVECEELIAEKLTELLEFPEAKTFRLIKAIAAKRVKSPEFSVHYDSLEALTLIENQEINFGSPKQLSELLYTANGFGIRATDPETGEVTMSTAADVLATLDHPFIEILVQYRALNKTLGTFFKGIQEKVHEGKLHAQFKLHGTKTGRASCISYSTKILLDTGEVEVGKLIPEFEGSKDISYLGLQALTHDGTYQLITHGINQGNQEVYEVELESGETVKCTLEHKFLTNKGWYCLKDIISLQSESNFIDNLKILTYGKSS